MTGTVSPAGHAAGGNDPRAGFLLSLRARDASEHTIRSYERTIGAYLGWLYLAFFRRRLFSLAFHLFRLFASLHRLATRWSLDRVDP